MGFWEGFKEMRSLETITQLIGHGRHFCIAPWIHLHITSLGNMCACCGEAKGPFSRGYGNINRASFQELWQGEAIREFRRKLLRDEADPRCAICDLQANLGLWNLRGWLNQLYAAKYSDWVTGTDETGFAPDAKPVYWDIRFSNLCNLKCRTCSFGASSSWYEDNRALGPANVRNTARNKGQMVIGLENTAKLLDDLEIYLPYLEKVTFAGGEPLLMDENYQILERLAALQQYEVELSYITNLTKLHYRQYDILTTWQKFKRLFVTISLDGLGPRSEYLRKGLRWEEALANWVELKQRCPQADIRVNYTLSAFNALHLPDFHRRMVDDGYMAANSLYINYLNDPKYYNAQILPAAMKGEVTAKFYNHIEWLKRQPAFENEAGSSEADGSSGAESAGPEQNGAASLVQWNHCIQFINDQDKTSLIPKFVELTGKLDQLRHEDCLSVFPELQPIFDAAREASQQ